MAENSAVVKYILSHEVNLKIVDLLLVEFLKKIPNLLGGKFDNRVGWKKCE